MARDSTSLAVADYRWREAAMAKVPTAGRAVSGRGCRLEQTP